MRKLLFTACVIIVVVLMAGCDQTVTEADVYRSTVIDPKLGGAKNILVEQTPQGMKISGSDVSVTALITAKSFQIKTEPEDAKVNYTIGDMILASDLGGMVIKANVKLGEDSAVPAYLPMQGSTAFDPTSVGFVPGASGSQNVSVKIDPAVGHTDVAGLQFEQEAVLNIWEDGTVEVDKAGIVASDVDGNQWVSKKVKFGDKTAVIMIRQ